MDVQEKPRLLMVDDDELASRAMRRQLSRTFDVVLAPSAEDALQILSGDAAFSAVVTDMMMPQTSGHEFYRIVKERFPGLEKRFVFATGGAFTNDAKTFLQREKVALLEKPYTDKDLLEVLSAKNLLS